MYQMLIFAGRLGRDPEMRYTPTGQAVTGFSVATDRTYTKGTEKVKETTWFNVTAWGKMAEVINEYGFKGQRVIVEGRLTPDSNGGPRIWTDKDGNPRASFEVNAGMVRFIDWKDDSAGGVEVSASASGIDPNRLRNAMTQRGGMSEAAKEVGGVEGDDPDEFPF